MSRSPARTQHLLQFWGSTSLTAVCLTFAAPAAASLREITAANNQLRVQLQSANVNYAETVNDADTGNTRTLDSEGGRVTGYGLAASATGNFIFGHDYFAAQYSAFSGTTEYTGATQAKPVFGSVTGQSGARINDGLVRYGRGMVIDEDTMTTLYGELGHHKYVRTLGLGTPYGYQETYTHNYYGIGALLQYAPTRDIVYALNLLIGRTYGARIETALPAPYSAYSAKLGNSTLYRIGIALDYAFTKRVHLNAGVDLMGWSYGASAMQQAGGGVYAYEPNSTTSVTTATLGLGYAF